MISKLNNTPLKPYFYVFSALLIFLTLTRLGLSIWLFERVSAVDGWLPVLIQGLRIDVATLCMLLVLPASVSMLLSGPRWLISAWNQVVKLWLTLVVFIMLFMEFTTPSFILEFNIRPNRLFIEYLIYPKEVVSMLLKGYLLESIFTNITCLLMGVFIWKRVGKVLSETEQLKWQWRISQFVVIFLLMVLGARSTLGHRPLNPAMVYFSTDPLVNSLILNSFYSTSFAAKQMFGEKKNKTLYGSLPEETVIQAARAYKGIADQAILNPAIPTLAKQIATYRGKPKNLVIVLEESLGARFVGSLGGLPLTPNFDQLSKQGWFFKSMLATGTRSVRGIEAVITGFSPTPFRAVVKRDKSQRNFFSIATLLGQKGYHTEFIYGGEAHFDNMKSFFLGNGFQVITEEKDYQNPTFVGSWGASDEDLFAKANQRFSQLTKDNKPFFSLVFSSSNHSPFEYPKGRIEPYDEQYNTRNNAIKYADWALGKFFKEAKQSNYWDDTLFLIIADHDANAHGQSLVPPKSFHIPALILGKDVEVKSEEKVRSQLDMPPTLLSMIGIDNENPMIGRDLTKVPSSAENLALLQYGQNFALLEGEQVTVLQPRKEAKNYLFDHQTFSLVDTEKEVDKDTYQRALALSLWGTLAYEKQLYRTAE
ncbi:MAG: LTA synthase family protein [Gammaproteobacteria bacterium]|nr:MAG: LTA synthase family protein [Gammaproteobacteria bacterium]